MTPPDSDITVKLDRAQGRLRSRRATGRQAPPRSGRAWARKSSTSRSSDVQKRQGRRRQAPGDRLTADLQNSALDGTPDEMVRISYSTLRRSIRPGRWAEDSARSRCLATDDGRVFYRGFGRTGLVGVGPLAMGKPLPVLGGDNMPMKISAGAGGGPEERGRLRRGLRPPGAAPRAHRKKALPAIEAELTIEGMTSSSCPPLRSGPSGARSGGRSSGTRRDYRVCYDFDRLPAGVPPGPQEVHAGQGPRLRLAGHVHERVELSDPEMGLIRGAQGHHDERAADPPRLDFYQSSFAS